MEGFFYCLRKIGGYDVSENSKSKTQLSTVYNPLEVEQDTYAFWENSGYFKAGRDLSKQPFSIVIPPPNVTGTLHLGHAWDNTIQDVIIRFKRMRGFDALWLPGTDHAGIATQTRVEKALLQQDGVTRHDLGREAFVDKVWSWKHQYGNIITNQIRALGASCDWSRERFTMDEGLSQAVREVFVQLYERGLIYRGNRIINWCPRCETALSDIEVEHNEVNGYLYHVSYPLSDGSHALTVATTRPETMFADVAIAVHPEDKRYAAFVGKTVRLPLTEREIPIIADEYVDPSFGTGCLKITPAHDPNDYEIGIRHGLAMPQCIDALGRMTEIAGEYCGLSRDEGRVVVVRDLHAQGFLQAKESILHAVGHCSRCDTVVEPYLSDQWFVRMEELAAPALARAQAGELRFVPERFEKVFIHWLENVRDWCISRQLWWGHRIPAWYCKNCHETTVSRDNVTHCKHCGSLHLAQDEDVLDTWFSSALWPFSTMGWPNQEAADLKRYYPVSALMTGYDILFFWVARMVFMGVAFTEQMPFQDVVLHGLIRASDGRKMSKSLGNGVDPLELIGQYGADALRFMLATSASPGNDMRFNYEKVESARNFINKIWNASRFVLMNLPADFKPIKQLGELHLGVADKWIVHQLHDTIGRTSGHLERYDFGEAGRAIYDFAWDDFCDWYIEFSKLSLYGENAAEKETTMHVLVYVLDAVLRLLHPLIPFVTERIWQSLPIEGEALIIADWPVAQSWMQNEGALRKMSIVMDTIRAVRNIRAELNVAPSKPIEMVVVPQDDDAQALLVSVRPYLIRFCQLSNLEINQFHAPPSRSMSAVVTGANLYLPLAGLVDLAAERTRLEKEKKRLEGEVERAEKKLANPQFTDKAPVEVVAAEREKLEDYKAKLRAVEARLASVTD